MSVVVGPLLLGAEPDAVPRARRFVDSALRDHYGQRVEQAEFREFTADARLVIAELATNALLHAGPPVTLRLVLNDDVCRVEVQDRSSAPPVPALPSPGAMTGRGLAVVDMLASRWGVQATAGDGKVVWAELRSSRDTSQPRAAADHTTDGDADDTAGSADSAGSAGSAGRDAEHWDIDRVLAQWAEEAEDEPQFTVTVGDVPTDLLLAAKSHIDNLVREFTLMASGAASGHARTPPPHLDQLIDVIVNRFGPARQAMKAQAVAAARRGDTRTVLTLTLPASAADAGAQYLDALDEADSYARASRLLTLETPPQHRVFRRWYVESLITQLRCAAAGQPPPPLRTLEQHLLDEIETVATAQRASERAARLQALTAALASALTPDDVASIVVGAAVPALGAGAGSLLTVADDEHFAVPGAVGYSKERVDALRAEPPDAELPAAVAIRTGKPVWLESRQARDIRFPGLRGFEPGTSSMCAVPLRMGDRVLGALRFSFPEPRLFDADERQFLLAFAAQTAQALERVLAVAAASRASERLALLAEASSVLADRFRLLVDAATDDAMVMLDPQGQVLTWSAGAHRVQGYDADEVIGEHFRRFYPPDTRAYRPQRALARAAAKGRHAEQGWRVRKDGTRFWAHVVITTLRGAQGDLIGFGLVTREVPAQAP